jgi:hypothetical protein
VVSGHGSSPSTLLSGLEPNLLLFDRSLTENAVLLGEPAGQEEPGDQSDHLADYKGAEQTSFFEE